MNYNMNSTYASVVTPGKLLRPFPISIKAKQFKPIHTYLEDYKIRKKVFTQNLPILHENTEPRVPILINFPVFGMQDQSQSFLRKKNSRLNRSCKLRKSFETTRSLVKDPFKIPELSYRTFEKFHLPSVKVKINLKTFSPKELPVIVKEISKESTPEIVNLPSRVEISTHSKEYGSKLNRVSEIVKLVELEHSQ